MSAMLLISARNAQQPAVGRSRLPSACLLSIQSIEGSVSGFVAVGVDYDAVAKAGRQRSSDKPASLTQRILSEKEDS